ncbi:hypothetical protein SAMN05192553_102942 [Cyclobacterium xiamenense]|uniref:Uncharacterized protein n=1 Tax=Cyclobacterium xiamenense TaxID=1297121 RepID=A0A1H6X3G6_9BACT|nr:hypothetical protein SAMN05192553_102942 [Cyclobacterium xiamenense]
MVYSRVDFYQHVLPKIGNVELPLFSELRRLQKNHNLAWVTLQLFVKVSSSKAPIFEVVRSKCRDSLSDLRFGRKKKEMRINKAFSTLTLCYTIHQLI